MKASQSFRVLAANVVAGFLLAASAQGAAYIKFDGIAGESTREGREGWIEVLGTSHGLLLPAVQAAREGARRQSAPRFDDFQITKQLDKSSPKLLLACAAGKHIKSVTIEYTDSDSDGETTYYSYELKNVQVSSFTSTSGEDRPSESLSLNFEEIKWTYTYRGEKGETEEIKGGWNLTTNTPINPEPAGTAQPSTTAQKPAKGAK